MKNQQKCSAEAEPKGSIYPERVFMTVEKKVKLSGFTCYAQFYMNSKLEVIADIYASENRSKRNIALKTEDGQPLTVPPQVLFNRIATYEPVDEDFDLKDWTWRFARTSIQQMLISCQPVSDDMLQFKQVCVQALQREYLS